MLLKLKEKNGSHKSTHIDLELAYENRNGEILKKSTRIDFERMINDIRSERKGMSYQNSGIRKGILLVSLKAILHKCIDEVNMIGRNGKTLQVTEKMKNELREYRKWFVEEMKALDDNGLKKELDLLDRFTYSKKVERDVIHQDG